jgi:hypothetical protein
MCTLLSPGHTPHPHTGKTGTLNDTESGCKDGIFSVHLSIVVPPLPEQTSFSLLFIYAYSAISGCKRGTKMQTSSLPSPSCPVLSPPTCGRYQKHRHYCQSTTVCITPRFTGTPVCPTPGLSVIPVNIKFIGPWAGNTKIKTTFREEKNRCAISIIASHCCLVRRITI